LYAETLEEGVFKKRRPAHRLADGSPSSNYTRKRKRNKEIHQALQSIEAVVDESGTVVTLIPCLEENHHETPPSSTDSYTPVLEVLLLSDLTS